MKQLRWQILIVLVTLGVVAVLLFSQQAPVTSGPFLPQPEQGGIYTEGLVGSLGRLNPLLDWNNPADRAINRENQSRTPHTRRQTDRNTAESTR